MKILRFPDDHLFTECKEVTIFSDELVILLERMFETMLNSNGVGLASNQVGLNYRMFTMLGPDDEKLFIINPIIISKSQYSANLKEGCLSAPGEFLIISDRVSWVQIKFQNEKGEEQIRVFKDIHAICVQHEMEHLEGKSYLQSKSLSKNVRKRLAKKWDLK